MILGIKIKNLEANLLIIIFLLFLLSKIIKIIISFNLQFNNIQAKAILFL